MKHLSICDKQQQMKHKHLWHETVVHMWQTTANETQASLTWNSCPYVANNSKWHTSMFDMKQLSICGKQQQMTHEHFWHERVIHMWQQQQKTYNHVWHETVIHMWQTTANDTQACFTWNSYPYVANNSKWQTTCLPWNSYPSVANNSKWHRSIFDMKQVSICSKQQQMTQACLTWNSYPYVANNSKWHTSMFDMKQLSMYVKQQQMTHKNFWHETVIHVLFIYLFKIYFTFLISQAVKLTIYTGRKTKIFTYNIRK